MTAAFTTTISPDGIVELKFDLPGEKINKFTLQVIEELEKVIDALAENKSIKALKMTSRKEGIFIAGADLHSFEPVFDNPKLAENLIQTGHRVFNKIAALPFPTVAVINGACLGGGLECALSFTYRLVTDSPKTLLALPETTLGIIPGWGGTQRLPRLIGLSEGLTMILTGRSASGVKAWKLHLADAISSPEFIEEKTDQFIQSILTKEGKKAVLSRRKQKGWFQAFLENNPLGRYLVFHQAKKAVLEKTKGHYPAPLIALELIKRTCSLPLAEGLKEEIKQFSSLPASAFKIAKNLIGLFFTQEAMKKETGAPPGTKTKEVKNAAVLGAGTMGAGIAWLLADHSIFTRLKDISWECIGKGLAFANGLFKKGLKAKKIQPYQADLRFQLISGTVDYSGFSHADVVIEAATENLELKRKIFKEVEANVREDAVIVSNTSSLTIDEMAKEMQHPERFVGMHFFNPVHKMPLVEVVPGKQSSNEAVATIVEFTRKLGKTPIVVGDCPGFLVNRVFLQSANEVMLMLEEGYSKESLIKATMDFGMPMDPFEVADEVGIDVTYKVGEMLEKGYGERMRPAKILKLMLDKGYLGKKNGKGFYIYKGRTKSWNPDADVLVQSLGKTSTSRMQENLMPRFLYGMINESARCLEEKVIDKPEYLDMALIMGIGFPPFQGGILRYADSIGTGSILKTLLQFEKTLGTRFAPCELLRKMAAENKSFYGNSKLQQDLVVKVNHVPALRQ